jgi:caffeoyl-CoA O-methyltransferase
MPPKAKFTVLDEKLYSYLVAHRTPDDDVALELREETARLGERSVMQISPDEAAFLRLLVAATGARSALEIGTFTGYSALAIARGLPAGGRLLCLDVSAEWTDVARRYWAAAGVADRIELRLGPAAESLRALPDAPTFDFAFIDADKKGYPVYWEEVVRRLRPNGLVAVDNVLRHGDVVRPEQTGESVTAIRQLNEMVVADARVESVMLAVADGLTLARRLP